MKTKELWFLFLIVLSIAANFYQIFSDRMTTGITIFIVIVIITIIISYIKLSRYIKKTIFLKNNIEVYDAIDNLLFDSNHINFCGKLDNVILSKFKTLCVNRSNKNNDKFCINILNTDPSFYSEPQNSSLISEILSLDSKHDHFNHKFYLYQQNINLLTGRHQGVEKIILFYTTHDDNYQGVYITKGTSFKFGTIIDDACPTVNIHEQLHNIQNVADKSLEFWKPLKKGWYQPVFPPDENAEIRKIWRSSLMSWFNSTANTMLSTGGEITITWKLEDYSLTDAQKFSIWLEKLKTIPTGSTIKIKRYMLLSKDRYTSDQNYKKIVDDVLNFLPAIPTPASSNYQVFFINSDKLTQTLNNDYALFELVNNENVAQDSDTDIKSGVEVLKIMFSKDFVFVNSVRNKIDQLASYSPKSTIVELQ